jgi:uncharacterized protein YndB with AHSA1/START domain
MSKTRGPKEPASGKLTAVLVVRRRINATPEALFAAWTQPALLVQWWGPQGVSCPEAEIDLRVGGAYRIANRFPDGTVVWIGGAFELIEPPRRLTYTWKLEGSGADLAERVSVCFEELGSATEVIVTHERISDEAARRSHERGWLGCLDGLVDYVKASRSG